MILKTKTPKAAADAISRIPPRYSHFQATMSMASKAKQGIRCIRKAPAFCQNVRSDENESSANKLRKRIARIHKILAVHRITFVDVFIWQWFGI